jgi:transcriptional regulator with XRE-family HTH domain
MSTPPAVVLIPPSARSLFHGVVQEETFKDRVRRLLAEREMTQEELARAIDAPLRTVTGWLSGAQPDAWRLEATATALGVTLDELLGGLYWSRPTPGDAAAGAADAKKTVDRAQRRAQSDTPRRRTQGQGPPRSA